MRINFGQIFIVTLIFIFLFGDYKQIKKNIQTNLNSLKNARLKNKKKGN